MEDTGGQDRRGTEDGEDTPLLESCNASLEGLDIDRLFVDKLGEFGRYQKWQYLLVCIPAAFTSAITMASVFTAFSPRHRCLTMCDDSVLPEYSDPYYFDWGNYTLPTNDGKYSSCERFSNITNTCTNSSFSTNKTEVCSQHVFDKRSVHHSLVSDFDLVCDNKDWLPFSQAFFFAGVMVGAALYGFLGDLLGRKTMFLVAMAQTAVFGLGAAYASSMAVFSVLQFFTAMGQLGLFQCAYILGIEIVGPSKRTFCGIVIEFFFVAGEIYLVMIAWWFRDWRKIQLLSVGPILVFLTYFFIVPESVRWLVQQKRYKEAGNVIKTIAKKNGVEVPSGEQLEIYRTIQPEAGSDSGKKEGLLDIRESPVLRTRLINVCFSWIVTTLLYYSISLGSSSLVGDIYYNFALVALAEVPGYLISYFGMCCLGRRFTLTASLILCGGACLVYSLVSVPTLKTIFFLISKFAVTASFGTIYLYTSELFPTKLRSCCVGLSSTCGRLGAIVSPYVSSLGSVTGLVWLPMVIMSVLAIVSGSLVCCLPETLGTKLPDSIPEAEKMGKILNAEEDD